MNAAMLIALSTANAAAWFTCGYRYHRRRMVRALRKATREHFARLAHVPTVDGAP